MFKTLKELKERRGAELIAEQKFNKQEFESQVSEHQKRDVIARVTALNGPGQRCCCEDRKLGTTVLRVEQLETTGLLFADKAARTNFMVSKAPCRLCGVELAKETEFLARMATAPARKVCSGDGMRKYFSQRFRLISRYQASLALSRTAWFSVSPEEISKHIARRVIALSRRLGRKIRVFDPFCGAGGFIVQAAVMDEVSKVFASDINEYEVNSARRMARLYGVPEEKISFKVSNFFDLEEDLFKNPIDAIICGPPWGGPSYSNGLFDLEKMEPDFVKILRHCAKFSPNIALLMPKNMALDQIHRSARVAGLTGG
ncbi:trimethylguanosine synthase-like, partial [Galendromus occidentalis]|uniref:Trimethylguanosine synthase n=1 Tax=Galendromus occidentalis TaxID=34638 RepID=A0AAJ7L3Y2_9ACAR